ncbi:MAG: phosphonoacetaldehyde hydrolase [Labilithrix sp.]|nr:phosphonoacetaldehyde hydrolase [Labilithrix sp.]
MARRIYRGPLKAILLDWAGTTMDYGCYAPAVVFVEVFKRQGVPITMDEARGPMGAHKRVHIAAIAKTPSVAARWRAARGRDCSEADIDVMFADFVPLQLACLADYADLIPGCLEAVAAFRARGLKIGSTTGYTISMMEILQREAKRRGYEPDATVCAEEVPFGRPEPWMCLENAKRLRVFPMEAIVKIGDTLPDILEGLDAGMWTVGLAKTGNEMGLNASEIARLPPSDLQRRLERAYARLYDTGAHYVVDSIADVPPLLDVIEARLASGDRP